MSSRGYNRGSRKPSNKPSRKVRQSIQQNVESKLLDRLNPQGTAYKNLLRQEIVRKAGITKSQKKILDKLGDTVHKVGEILNIVMAKEKREKKKELEKKSDSLSRTIGKKVGRGLWKHQEAAVVGALALGSLAFGDYFDDEKETSDEAVAGVGAEPKLGEFGVQNGFKIQDFNGAKIAIKDGVRLDGLNSDFWRRFTGAVREYQEKYGGGPIQVNSAFRSHDEQKKLFEDPNYKAAEPGYSMHEYGFALDMQSGDANAMDRYGLLSKWKLGRPDLKYRNGEYIETWHVEDMNGDVQAEKLKLYQKKGTQEAKSIMGNLDRLTPTAQWHVDEKKAATPLDEETLKRWLEVRKINNDQYNYLVSIMHQLDERKNRKKAEEDKRLDTIIKNSPMNLNPESETTPFSEISNISNGWNVGSLGLAEGGMVDVVAGEAGPELVLPMNDRGSSMLAEAIRQAFGELMAESARSKKDKMRMERMRTFFSETFIPKLKSELGS